MANPHLTEEAGTKTAISPQLENGYTRIANEIMEALANKETTGNLTSYDFRVLIAIIRKTYGYRKKVDWISNSQLVKMTGIEKQNVSRTMTGLCKRRFLLRLEKMVGLNKNYHEWERIFNKKRKLSNEITIERLEHKDELSQTTTKVITGDVKSYHGRGTQNSIKENKGVSPKDGSTLAGESQKIEPQSKEEPLPPAESDFPSKGVQDSLTLDGTTLPSPELKKVWKSRKQPDPRIKRLIDRFISLHQEIRTSKHAISKSSWKAYGGLLKYRLQEYPEEKIAEMLTFYVQSEKCEKYSSLTAALSDDSINLYNEHEAKKIQRYPIKIEIPNYKRQHA